MSRWLLESTRFGAVAGVALGLLVGCDVSRPVRVDYDGGAGCPTLPENLTLDSTCEGRRCVLVSQQSGCDFELAVDVCMLDVFEGRVLADGTLSFTKSDTLGQCTPVNTLAGAAHSFECASPHGVCHYDLYPPPPRSELTLQALPLVSSSFASPGTTEGEPLDEFDPTTGFLAHQLVLDDAVWVATRSGSFGTLECDEPEPAELVEIDLESVTVRRRVDAPPCLARLAPDPTGRGRFLGVTSGRQPQLHRFDASGRTVTSTRVPPPTLPSPDDDLVPVGLFTDSSTTIALVLSTLRPSGGAWLLTLDAVTLGLRATSMPTAAQLRASTGIHRQRVYAADRHNAAVMAFDVLNTTLSAGERLSVQPARGGSDNAGFLYLHPPTGKLLVATTGRRGAMWALDPESRGNGQRAFAYEQEMIPWAVTAWPGKTDRVAVGLMVAYPGLSAMVAAYSITENRFLPGATRLGQGVVGALDVDPRGRLWAMLPWDGQIVRVTVP